MSNPKAMSSKSSHLRGSFAAATGEVRRRNSNTPGPPVQQPEATEVPTNLEALLKRAEATGQPQEGASALIFTDSSADAGDSQFAFPNGARFAPTEPSVDGSADQLHEEISVLQHALINRFRGSQKAVSGCQFRISAPQKFSKCENCDARDKALNKAKEMIRRLKNQDRSQTTATSRRVPEDNEALFRVTAERDELSRRNGALNTEIQRLSTLMSEKAAVPPVVGGSPTNGKRELENQIQTLMEQNQMLSDVIRDISDQKDALEGRNSSLESQLDEKGRVHAELQDLYSRHEQEHTNEINSLKLQLKNEKQAHIDNAKAVQDRSAAEIAEMKSAHEHLARDKKSLSDEISSLTDTVEATRASLIEEKKASILISEENQGLAQKIKESLEDIANMQKHQKVAENEVQFSKEMIEKLKEQVKTLSSEREQVLQTAISGSVRLCIVAPTVNVHVADKKLNFRSRVPTEELNTFLQQEILTKYTFLFRQDTEDRSPDPSIPLQAFMQKALAEMQSVIESHIYAAMGSNKE